VCIEGWLITHHPPDAQGWSGSRKRFRQLKKAIQLEPNSHIPHLQLAAIYIMMGREKEARAEATEVLRRNPKFSVDSYAKKSLYKDRSETDKVVNAWRKAGLK